MKIRTLAAAVAACAVLVVAGCGSSVAGQAEIAPGASVPATSQSAPSPFPDPTSGGSTPSGPSSTSQSPTGESSATGSTETAAPQSTVESTTQGTESSPSTDGSRTTGSDPEDTTPVPTPLTSVPGLSKDCNAVLAGITAFSKLLQGAGSTDSISQAAVDEALRQLPESGLPARPQADITVLRTTVSEAVGKSLADLAQTLADGTVVDALKDLSSWAEANCG